MMRLSDLRRQNLRAIAGAGPRYAPGLDEAAPNLAIVSLDHAFESIGMTADFRSGVARIRTAFQSAWHDAPSHVRRRFRRLVNTPSLLLSRLSDVEVAAPADAGYRLRRAALATSRIEAVARRASDEALRALQAAPPDTAERRERDGDFGGAQRFVFAVRAVLDFLNSNSSALLQKNTLLLLGSWGMGKTHSLCDLTRRRMARRLPTLLCLAQHLQDGMHPLTALCQATGLAPNLAALLTGLNRMGRQTGGRSLLIVDAINEGDRRGWRRALLGLTRELRRYPNVGLILSLPSAI